MRASPIQSHLPRSLTLGVIASALTVLSGCGGGTATDSTALPLLTLQGVAATGLAIADGLVEARCDGGSGSARSLADGSFSLTTAGAQPCLLKVSATDGTVLHAVLPADTSWANINPVTEGIAALTLGRSPAEAFEHFDAASAQQINAGNLAAAVSELSRSLEAIGLDTAAVADLQGAPMQARQQAADGRLLVAGDAIDQQLDSYNAALVEQGLDWATLTQRQPQPQPLALTLPQRSAKALSARSVAADATASPAGWQTNSAGLPADAVLRGQLAVVGDMVFAAVQSASQGRAIYRLDTQALSAGWTLYTKVFDANIVAVNGRLFVGPGSGGTSYWLSDEADGFGGRKLYAISADSKAQRRIGQLWAGQTRLLAASQQDGAPAVWHYDLSQLARATPAALAAAQMTPVGQKKLPTPVPIGAWVDTGLNIQVANAKPHTQVFEDGQQGIWYVTNYADNASNNGGSFRFDGRNWHKMFGALSATSSGPNKGKPGSGNAPGKFSVTRDGTLIVSVELMPTTQISSFFRYDPASTHPGKLFGALVPIASSPGYGLGSVPLDGDKNVFIDGRFGQFILGGQGATAGLKKWALPDVTEGFVGATVLPIDVRIPAYAATANGTLVAYMNSNKSNAIWRIATYQADVARAPYYTAVIDLDGGAVAATPLVAATDSAERMAVRWLDANQLAAAFNSDGALTSADVCLPLFGKPACGSGALALMNASGSISKAYRFDSPVRDMKLRLVAGQQVAVLAFDDGFALFDFSTGLATPLAAKGALRVDLSPAGRVATLAMAGPGSYSFAVYPNLGAFAARLPAFTNTVARSYVEDIALSDTAARAVIVGFDNKKMPTGKPIQVAFAQAFDLGNGEQRWMKFGFDGKDTSANVADTRLLRARLGDDGDLYLTGESAGSETIFRFNGDAPSGVMPLKFSDFYNQLWNTASAHMSYYAQLDAASGSIRQSQLAMSRLSSGKSNTFRVRDITVAQGRVFMPALAASAIGNRDANLLNGQAVGQYAGGDPVLLAVDGINFANRLAWTPLVKSDNAQGDMRSVDAYGSKVALLGYANASNAAPAAVACGASDCALDARRRPYLVVLDAERNFSIGR